MIDVDAVLRDHDIAPDAYTATVIRRLAIQYRTLWDQYVAGEVDRASLTPSERNAVLTLTIYTAAPEKRTTEAQRRTEVTATAPKAPPRKPPMRRR